MGTTQKRTRKDLIANIERITKEGNIEGDLTLAQIIGLRSDWRELARYRCQGYVKWNDLGTGHAWVTLLPLARFSAVGEAKRHKRRGCTGVRLLSVWVKVK